MGFVGKEGLQPSGTTYRVALLHMAPVRSVMSRFVFQARIYLRNSSRPKPQNGLGAEKAAIERYPSRVVIVPATSLREGTHLLLAWSPKTRYVLAVGIRERRRESL
jgi:hypothetical protein